MQTTLIAAAVAAVIGFGAGWKTESWRNDAAELVRQKTEVSDQMKKAEHGDKAAAGHEEFKTKEEIRYVTRTQIVNKIVERPVYLRECFDPDGVRLLNDAIAGRDSTSQPAPAVSGPAKPLK